MLVGSKIKFSKVSSNPNRLNGSLHNPKLHITTEKLNGKKFLEWSHTGKLFLRSKKKMGYILEMIKAPKITDPLFESWDSKNSMIMS